MCLEALYRVVFFEGCAEVSEQLQAWFCGVAFRRAGALTESVPELCLPPVNFVPDSISAAQREPPCCALIECLINAACGFAHGSEQLVQR